MIDLQEITLNRGGKRVLDRFNLKIEPQERLVISGASGSGKSTLLRLMAGLLVPDCGEIWIQGRLATHHQQRLIPPHQRDMNMVFQDLALWTHLDVGRNITFALEIQGVEPNHMRFKRDRILEMVGLRGYANRSIDTLSGGEQQRVALARALVSEPKILLMDEPLSHLDRPNRERLSQEIITLQEHLGFTLVYVTHDAYEMEHIATRMVGLLNGSMPLN